MKILFVSREALWPTGIGTHTMTTARALAARGHEVHVLTCGFQSPEDDEIRDGVWVHRRRLIRVRGLGRLLRAPMVRWFVRLLRPPDFPPWTSPALRVNAAISNYLEYRRLGIDFDLIEAPEHLAESLVFALLGTRPVVVDLHGPLGVVVPYWGYRPGWHLRISDRLERLAARRATLTIAPSRLAARELALAGWRGARRARVVPHMIDGHDWSHVPPVSATEPIILSVGEVGPLKASDVLVRAAAKLSRRNEEIEVVFVGPSMPKPNGTPSRDLIASLAAELGVRCSFGDYVPREELDEWYGRARVVAVPSRFDSFSQVGLEALAAGRPVVCSTRTGLAELTDEARGAIAVVPVEDAEALARALEPVLADPTEAAQRGRLGRAFVDQRSDRVAAEREAVYREATDRWRDRKWARASRDKRLRFERPLEERPETRGPRSLGRGRGTGAVSEGDMMTLPAKVVCITGMHRSGTSLVAGVVNILGVDFGPPESMLEPGEENLRGFWEQHPMADLNDEILAALGGSWRDPPVLAEGWELSPSLDSFRARGASLLERLFDGASLACWKDPRTSILLPFWRTVVQVSATILVYRDPRHVADSLARRDGVEAEHAAHLWLRYAVGAWRNDPHNLRVNYERFFDDLDHQLTRLCDYLGLPSPTIRARGAIGDLVDPSLRRAGIPGESGPMMGSALELYRLLEGPGDELDPTIDGFDGLVGASMRSDSPSS